MRACPNEGGRRAILAAALLIAFGAAAAAEPLRLAQAGPPTRLTPPPARPAPAAEPPPPARAPTAEDSLDITPLPPPDPGALPLLDGEAALPADAWRGTPRATAVAALQLLGPSRSPALQRLTQRLLLSAVAADADDTAADTLLLARAERLFAIGAVPGAAALLARAGDPDERIARRRAELAFLAGDAAACRMIEDGVARHATAWWDRALVACRALAGEHAKASLGLDLMRERGAAPDENFVALIEQLAGGRPAPRRIPEDAVALALARAAKRDLAEIGAPALARAVALDAAAPPLQRLAAGERAAALGALTPAEFAGLAREAELPAADLNEALSRAGSKPDARGRALLAAAAARQEAPAVRAELVHAYLPALRQAGLAADLAQPFLDDLAVHPDLAHLAPEAARFWLSAGDSGRAEAWLALAAPAAVKGLRPALALAAPGAAPATDADPPPARAALVMALRDALGEADAAAWPTLVGKVEPGPPADPALTIAQARALREGRLGEALALTVALLGDGDALTRDPVRLHRGAAALRALGFAVEARQVAVEAALAAAE